MKEKIIRILRILLFDAFKSRWAWRRIPAEMFLNYMNKKRKNKITNTPLPYEYDQISKKTEDIRFKNSLIISFGQGCYYGGIHYFECNCLCLKYKKLTSNAYSNYLSHLDELVAYFIDIILINNYTRVILFGPSTVGFSTILYSHILSGKCPYTQFYAISSAGRISAKRDPQIKYDKKTLELLQTYSSYHTLKKKLQVPRQNLFIYMLVGQYHSLDCADAFRLRACKYLKALDDMMTDTHHITMMLLTDIKYVNDDKKLANLLRLMKAENKAYEDEKKGLELIRKVFYKNGKRLSSLNELIYELITTGKITALYK